MAANQPAAGRDILKAGMDVRAIRKPINEAFRSVPREFITTGSASYVDGGRVSLASLGPDAFWLRLNTKDTGNTPIRYGWTQVYHDRANGTWANLSVSGNSTDDGHAIELNNANLTVGSATRYPARLDPQSGRVTFFQGNGGSGGTVNATSTETVLMILGDYSTYANCPNVPGSPPTLTDDYCNGTTGSTLCVPAYAYAVYQRCGYKWNKTGDTRTYQVWANEMNGQSFSAWRRFVIPRWGGNLTASGPDPDDDCIGVAFLGTGTGSALTCSCPPCLSSPPAGVTLCLKFRTIARPTSPAECIDLINEMDTYDAWEKDFVIELTGVGGYCSATGSDPNNIFTVNWDWQDGASLDPCDWGPDEFDPCDPCWHWGRLLASITVPGGNDPNCGSPGHWTGEFRAKEVCDLLCDCVGPVTPIDQVFCQGCGNVTPPQFNVIEEGSIELICCDSEPPPNNLFAFYKPGVEQSSGSTATWGNQGTWSLTNLDMVQTTASRVPSITTVGGFDAFSFVDDATAANDDYLLAAATGYSVLNGKAGATIFAVFEFNSAQTADGGIFGIQNGAAVYAAAMHIVMLNSGGTMYPAILYRRTATDSDTTVTSSVGMSNGSLYAVIGRVNFASGSQALKINVNGTETTGTAPSGTPYSFTCYNESPVVGVLRRGVSNPSWPSTVKVLECGAYDVYLDDATTTDLEEYLAWKYGL